MRLNHFKSDDVKPSLKDESKFRAHRMWMTSLLIFIFIYSFDSIKRKIFPVTERYFPISLKYSVRFDKVRYFIATHTNAPFFTINSTSTNRSIEMDARKMLFVESILWCYVLSIDANRSSTDDTQTRYTLCM